MSDKRVPEPFLASASFAEILRAAGLGDIDMDVFRMLEDARQLVIDGDMEADEYEQLAKGVQLQLLQLVTGGSLRAVPPSHLEGKSQPKPSQVELPNEKPIVESYLMKLPVASAMNPLPKQFKKRYVVLYKSCLVYFANKGDKQPKGRIDLTPDFFVQDSTAHPHGFVLSDMSTTITLGAETEELKGYWVHMCAMVLRKLHDNDQPAMIRSEAEDEASRVQQEFEKKLQKFKKEKANRRQSMFFRRKTKDEDVIKEATETAVAQTTKELRERELQRQKELEELQRRLDEAESEKMRYKDEAAQEHERADREAARAEEEQARRADAEERLQKTLEDLRAESLAREEALLAEKEEIMARLNQVNIKRRQSMMPGTESPVNNADAEKWEKERKALQAKLDALMDALNVDLGNLEWDGTLEDAEQKMKELVPALCSEDEKVAREAQAKFDQYDKVIRNHADYKVREEQKWVKWEEENAPKNQRALDEMKRIVPHEVTTGISQEFLTQQCHLTLEVAQRIMKTKILQFLYMDSDVIAKIHIADLSSRYVPQGLDIRELRAIYACLPKEFQLDSDGRKKLWRDDCRNKLHAMTEKEKNGNLPKNEQLAAAYRPKEERKAAPAAGGGGGGGGAGRANPMAGALNNLFAGRGGPPAGNTASVKLDTSALQNALAAKLGGGGRPPNPMLQRSAEAAEKEEKVKESADLLAMLKKTHTPAAAESAPAPASSPKATAAPTPAPAATSSAGEKKASLLPSRAPAGSVGTAPATANANAPKKLSAMPQPAPAPAAERKPMVDLGFKFNAPPKKEEPEGLIGSDARELFNRAAAKTLTADEFEGDVPAYDFEANYYATQKRKTWVDDGIKKLTDLIEQHGAYDKAEGGKKTATFGKIYENFGSNSDMLVGILMRARKKGKIKYVGDMLFKGVHDDVKITVVS